MFRSAFHVHHILFQFIVCCSLIHFIHSKTLWFVKMIYDYVSVVSSWLIADAVGLNENMSHRKIGFYLNSVKSEDKLLKNDLSLGSLATWIQVMSEC